MTDIICNMCNSVMKFKGFIHSNRHYKIRRFECACGYKKTMFGTSYIDEEIAPEEALNDVNKMYEQQSKNN